MGLITKKITEMDCIEAKKFLLDSSSYSTLNLPSYFNFNKVLKKSINKLNGKDLSFFQNNDPKMSDVENTNYVLFANKNGKYSWRPLTLIHPLAYVDLVNTICEKENWNQILHVLRNEDLKKIHCMSLPVKSIGHSDQTKGRIVNWWKNMEQVQIELSLKFNVMLSTDITDCYPSIYTHSIEWAINDKELAKEQRFKRNNSLGQLLDKKIRNMQYGQTNGIPQGSVLMDLIAEIILAAIDAELEQTVDEYFKDKYNDYVILRYRDDYKIFTTNKQDAEQIIKILSQCLLSWNFKLSERKTSFSENIILDSVKDDKLYWNFYSTLLSQDITGTSIQKSLLQILLLAKQFPNSGSISKALGDLYKNRIKQLNNTPKDYIQIIAIITDILVNNPRVVAIGITIISKIISLLADKEDNYEIIKSIIRDINLKIERSPNSEFAEIWLQRLAKPYKIDFNSNSLLCKSLAGNLSIWNSDWLKGKKESFDFLKDIIDKEEIKKLTLVIPVQDIDPFY